MNELNMIDLADAAMAEVGLFPDEDGPWYRSEPYCVATMRAEDPTFFGKLFGSERHATFGVEIKNDGSVQNVSFRGPFSETLARTVAFISSNSKG